MSRRDTVRVVQHADDDDEDEAESSASDLEDEGGSAEDGSDEDAADVASAPPPPERAKKIKISLTAAKAAAAAAGGCKVCGGSDHAAGFQGSVYLDCINRPCYLCKQPGHTTATCPFRLAPEHGCATPARSVRCAASAVLRMAAREAGRPAPPPADYALPRDWNVTSAVLKLHSRRVTALEFHPQRDSLIVSADKGGQVAFWDYVDVHERTVLDRGSAHLWLVSALKYFPDDGEYVYSTSVDGTVCQINVETHAVTRLCTVNPGLSWSEEGPNPDWRHVYSADVDASRRAILLGDDAGRVHVADVRAGRVAGSVQVAKKGTKVVALGVNPAEPSVFVSGGNDHAARVWDVRACSLHGGAGSSADSAAGAAGARALALALATLPHPRVVNAAHFSPHTGRKLLTTCQDNRLRIWDDVAAAPFRPVPDRELVHSHDFSRYLTPFKAVWDPKDASEAAFCIGRYISEDYGGVALHPIDVLSATSGRLLAELTDANVPTICTVVVPHPRREVFATGSSRNLFVWEPVPPADDAEDALRAAADAARAGGGAGAAAARARAAIPRMLDLDDGSKRKKGGRGAKEEEDDDDEGPGGKKKWRGAA